MFLVRTIFKLQQHVLCDFYTLIQHRMEMTHEQIVKNVIHSLQVDSNAPSVRPWGEPTAFQGARRYYYISPGMKAKDQLISLLSLSNLQIVTSTLCGAYTALLMRDS